MAMRGLVSTAMLLVLAGACQSEVEKRGNVFVQAAQAEAKARLAVLRGDPCEGVDRTIRPGFSLQLADEDPADIAALRKKSDEAWKGATLSMAAPELAAALNEVHKALLALRNNHGALRSSCMEDPTGNGQELFRRQMGETGGWLEKKVEEADDVL